MRRSDREREPSPGQGWKWTTYSQCGKIAWIKCCLHPEAFLSISHGSQTTPSLRQTHGARLFSVHFSVVTARPLWNMLQIWYSLVPFRTWFRFEVTYISFLLNASFRSSVFFLFTLGALWLTSLFACAARRSYWEISASEKQPESKQVSQAWGQTIDLTRVH